MKKIRIGLGRYYNGNMVELIDDDKSHLKLDMSPYQIEVSLSDKTKHWLGAVEMFPPVSKDSDLSKGKSNRNPVFTPGPEKFPADLYIEIVASRIIDVPDDIAERFLNKDQAARDEVFKLAIPHTKKLKMVLDFASGLVGLRISPELVRVPILDHDQLYAYREGKSYSFSWAMLNIKLQNPAKINASEKGKYYMLDRISKIKQGKDWPKMTQALGWLLRGWEADDDKILRFVSFFTALESIIPKVENSFTDKFNQSKLRSIEIANSILDMDEKEILASFINSIQAPMPLSASFENWALKSELTDWEKDVYAFKKYNRIRNLLLHSGDLSGIEQVPIEGQNMITLEEIAIKYISYFIFGEASLYDATIPS